MGQMVEAFMDPKTYLFFLFGFTANVPNGGTSNFGTLIVKGFGFNTYEPLLLSPSGRSCASQVQDDADANSVWCPHRPVVRHGCRRLVSRV